MSGKRKYEKKIDGLMGEVGQLKNEVNRYFVWMGAITAERVAVPV